MELKSSCINILKQVGSIIDQIDDNDFSKKSVNLNGSTLGQHFRHAIEFFQCLEIGSVNGKICYDERKHDITLESDKRLAMDVISGLQDFVESVDLSQSLSLMVSYSQDTDESLLIPSNMAREIVYNIEHLVHHMALVKIGAKELCPQIILPDDFGIAVSTMKYHRSLA